MVKQCHPILPVSGNFHDWLKSSERGERLGKENVSTDTLLLFLGSEQRGGSDTSRIGHQNRSDGGDYKSLVDIMSSMTDALGSTLSTEM